MTLDSAKLAEIEERAAAATAGPWQRGTATGSTAWVGTSGQYGYNLEARDLEGQRDADFIAHARQDVPALCRAVRERDARIAHLESLLGDLGSTGLDPIEQRARDLMEEGARLGLREAERIADAVHDKALADSQEAEGSEFAKRMLRHRAQGAQAASAAIAAACSAGPVAAIEERGRRAGLAEAEAIVRERAKEDPPMGTSASWHSYRRTVLHNAATEIAALAAKEGA